MSRSRYNSGGVNKSQLAWALPRLERYIQWDFSNRDVDNDHLLNWHRGTESGLDNSPLWDPPHNNALHMGATEFSSYVREWPPACLLTTLSIVTTSSNMLCPLYAETGRARDALHCAVPRHLGQPDWCHYSYRDSAIF
jgi:hypothetical protein